jgi:leader peptidase (prepilin peptidase)/N-methyltransferase
MPAYIPTLLLIAVLAPIAWIDARRQMIPDSLNLLLGILGLFHIHAEQGADAIPQRLVAAAALAIFFLGLRKLYQAIRGQTGLGLGDVKFLTAATLWLGPLGLPWLVLFASISGLAWHIVATFPRGGSASALQRIAFGPHLAVGFLIAWTWQPHNLL